MKTGKKILLCEFHGETNTFNPLLQDLAAFSAVRFLEGEEACRVCRKLPCAVHGMMDAIEKAGGEIIPSVFLYNVAGGRVQEDVYRLLKKKVRETAERTGRIDGACVSLHGATCTEEENDAAGAFLGFLRELLGERAIIAATFDLHANITGRILEKADVVCGYHTYPHVDHYETGFRAASLCMKKLEGEEVRMAAVSLPMMIPPAAYTTREGPFRDVIALGEEMEKEEGILDFTVCCVQPWLDIEEIGSCVLVIAAEEEKAKAAADRLAEKFFSVRNDMRTDLMSVDEVIDRAEANETGKPVVLADAADSPNGGAVGDSVAVALRLLERGSKLHTGMFVKDPEAVKTAFAAGVGNRAVFEVGGKYTPDMPGPLRAEGTVCSLHDGHFVQEGPAARGMSCTVGKTAVVRFGNIDMMICEAPASSGDPQILRHFGIEPSLCDLVVVKANTSFRIPYEPMAAEICYADTPGAGASNLHLFHWKHLPHPFFPFDLPEDYVPEKAGICGHDSRRQDTAAAADGARLQKK